MISKLTSLRPSQVRAGERPPRNNLRAWLSTPKGRVFQVVLTGALLMMFAAPARAANPPDPLVSLLGIPSKHDGHHYYYVFHRFGHKYVCRIWAYGSAHQVRSYVEQCITATRSISKPTGPAS